MNNPIWNGGAKMFCNQLGFLLRISWSCDVYIWFYGPITVTTPSNSGQSSLSLQEIGFIIISLFLIKLSSLFQGIYSM